ncbi:hypothetical protein NB643_04085 [Oxalobacter aliiformigenes]|uniref:Uncharacterized protein n=1 Tax=Oxalobacter aliiformigenes TaxID=2946593 RepID=A0ABY7JFC7_9BURK|nr:hypothetical protein [Oxalobacter aliiformigenes]WAV92559.1 hypothetical protein NB641_07030 [Oxalobacter aliiformigenes]WAV95933.1 hypothetical protein NB643_04085 [Oxalobacter aliiformigenes]WAV96277.1 hypothetical protein NB645_05325 [Oxalobacter aliiformigenes]
MGATWHHEEIIHHKETSVSQGNVPEGMNPSSIAICRASIATTVLKAGKVLEKRNDSSVQGLFRQSERFGNFPNSEHFAGIAANFSVKHH